MESAKDAFEALVSEFKETILVDFLGVIAIYSNGEKVEAVTKAEAAPEKIEEMIRRYNTKRWAHAE